MTKVKRHKQSKRRAWARAYGIMPAFKCPNCGMELQQGDGHFFPPSLGEAGYYICVSHAR